jgi:hypothetical protein
MISKKLLVLLSVLALVALMQPADCKTVPKTNQLGHKLPDEALENMDETFHAGRLYKRSSEDSDEESDEEEDEEVSTKSESSVDEEDDDEDEDLPEATTPVPGKKSKSNGKLI